MKMWKGKNYLQKMGGGGGGECMQNKYSQTFSCAVI
jgi:hypothetical protein